MYKKIAYRTLKAFIKHLIEPEQTNSIAFSPKGKTNKISICLFLYLSIFFYQRVNIDSFAHDLSTNLEKSKLFSDSAFV